jgi:hypothetical protein
VIGVSNVFHAILADAEAGLRISQTASALIYTLSCVRVGACPTDGILAVTSQLFASLVATSYMSAKPVTVSSIANVLLPQEVRYPLSAEDEQDPRLRPRRSLRKLWLVLAASVLFHGLLIYLLPKPAPPTVDASGPSQGPLQVTMSPPPAADRAPPPQTATPAPTPTPKVPPRTVIATTKPSTEMPPVFVPPETPTPPKPTKPTEAAPPLDFASALEARRAQRQAQDNVYAQQNADARASERELTAAERADAAFRRNAQTLGASRDGTSGVFQIRSLGSRYAAFSFRGWTNDRNNAKQQLIEVDAGLGGDVQIATVRRMIELIREHYKGNFNWESHRLGRVVVLSARMEDSDGLEAFLIKEFFG